MKRIQAKTGRGASAARAPRAYAAMVLLAALLAAAEAPAAETSSCGNGVACKCNATVRGTVRLEADLVGCGPIGLNMSPGAVLDCAGHEIRGLGPKESHNGVRADRVVDAQIRNCKVNGFERGIRIRGGQRVVVEGN